MTSSVEQSWQDYDQRLHDFIQARVYNKSAAGIEEIVSQLEEVGFSKVSVRPSDESKKIISDWTPDKNITDFIASATIEAMNP